MHGWVYSNPVSQSFAIGFTDQKEGLKQVRVFDMLGKEVMNVENCSGNTVNIANLPAGMYIVRVQSQSSKVYSAKLVKK
ncbi:MAG: T9SS type A sorting domain-containing protein [Bacteroidales bacterium]|nr:T9SS type A sorting domain-containing protein [Bacteroidales bacterium]